MKSNPSDRLVEIDRADENVGGRSVEVGYERDRFGRRLIGEVARSAGIRIEQGIPAIRKDYPGIGIEDLFEIPEIVEIENYPFPLEFRGLALVGILQRFTARGSSE